MQDSKQPPPPFPRFLGALTLVILTVYLPHSWFLATHLGWLDIWHLLPGFPAVLLGYFGVSHQNSGVMIKVLAVIVPFTAMLLFLFFPSRRKRIAGVTTLVSALSSFLAYLVSLA